MRAIIQCESLSVPVYPPCAQCSLSERSVFSYLSYRSLVHLCTSYLRPKHIFLFICLTFQTLSACKAKYIPTFMTWNSSLCSKWDEINKWIVIALHDQRWAELPLISPNCGPIRSPLRAHCPLDPRADLIVVRHDSNWPINPLVVLSLVDQNYLFWFSLEFSLTYSSIQEFVKFLLVIRFLSSNAICNREVVSEHKTNQWNAMS